MLTGRPLSVAGCLVAAQALKAMLFLSGRDRGRLPVYTLSKVCFLEHFKTSGATCLRNEINGNRALSERGPFAVLWGISSNMNQLLILRDIYNLIM